MQQVLNFDGTGYIAELESNQPPTDPALDGQSSGEEAFSREDLMALELHEARVKVAALQQRVIEFEIEGMRRAQAESLRVLSDSHARKVADFRRHTAAYKAFCKALGTRYNVDMDIVSYDDQTGRIHR